MGSNIRAHQSQRQGVTRIHTRSSNSTVTLKGKHGTAVMRNSLQCSHNVGGREGHVMALLRLNTQKIPTDHTDPTSSTPHCSTRKAR